eukprot:3070208-Amphidinium_carterae.1
MVVQIASPNVILEDWKHAIYQMSIHPERLKMKLRQGLWKWRLQDPAHSMFDDFVPTQSHVRWL